MTLSTSLMLSLPVCLCACARRPVCLSLTRYYKFIFYGTGSATAYGAAEPPDRTPSLQSRQRLYENSLPWPPFYHFPPEGPGVTQNSGDTSGRVSGVSAESRPLRSIFNFYLQKE